MMPISTTWMDLRDYQPPGEVRQKKTHIKQLIRNLNKQKNDTNEFIYETKGDSRIQKKLYIHKEDGEINQSLGLTYTNYM